MVGIVIALTIGFLLGILLMVFLVSGREEEKLLERVEQLETYRRLPANGSEQGGEDAGQASGQGGPGLQERN